MLRKQVEKAEPVGKGQRELVATRVAEAFNRLPPDKQRTFVDDTLTSLVNMTREQMGKLFGQFLKRGRPSTQELELLNQLIVVFTYSVKPEFQFHYASMIYKGLKEQIPADLPEKLQEVRTKKWLHIPLSPEVYDQLYEEFENLDRLDYDEFFIALLSRGCTYCSDR